MVLTAVWIFSMKTEEQLFGSTRTKTGFKKSRLISFPSEASKEADIIPEQ